MSRPQGARTLRMFSVIELNESEMNMPSVFALPAKYVDGMKIMVLICSVSIQSAIQQSVISTKMHF